MKVKLLLIFRPKWKHLTMLEKGILREPGVEPGTIAWKATMLTVTPFTLAFPQNLSAELKL